MFPLFHLVIFELILLGLYLYFVKNKKLKRIEDIMKESNLLM